MAPITLDSFVTSTVDDLDLNSSSTTNNSIDTQFEQDAKSAIATVLLISSQQAAQDGSYQTLLTQLNQKGQTDTFMVDRITEGAVTLASSQYEHVSLLLPDNIITGSLLAIIEPSLTHGGSLEVRGAAADSDQVASELKLAGFTSVTKNQDTLTSVKPSATTSSSLSLKRPATDASSSSTENGNTAIKLPGRTSKAAKASLWAFTTASATHSNNGTSTPTIDESTLLTEQDLERPNLIKRQDCDVKTTRKACKNCSCGLRELILSEQDDLVQAGFPSQTEAGSVGNGQKTMSAMPTSSCGNCYLGDAFRCSGCPYLGMPAFEPGEKVKLSNMDDELAT
ncbi:electron carrier [Microbotryomycetes sp. JL221]|nr:electron carrier [Microbotryomycetes sp. JL221]